MKIVVIAPHPDDEAIGCGGLIAKNVQAGNSVIVIYMTDGGRGIPGTDPQEASKIRIGESLLAGAILGVTHQVWLGYPDGSLPYNEQSITSLRSHLDAFRPDVIYVTHERESHGDHRIAAKLTREAVNRIENYVPEVLTYEVWTPLSVVSRTVDITDVVLNKIDAINAHQSQQSRQNFATAAIGLNQYRGVMQGHCSYAECFGKLRTSGREGMKIAVVLLTYTPDIGHDRAKYAYKTLTSFLDNISVDVGDELQIHIADDGSPQEHIDKLARICKDHNYEPSFSQSNRRGYGGSYNMATQLIHGDFDLILPMEDDWQLLKPLNLSPLAKAIDESNGEIRCIRLGYLGFTSELRGKLVYSANQLYLLFDPQSPEHHVFAGHPRLETVAFERDIGPWPENMRAGDVEWEVTHRWPARVGVAWPLDLGIPAGQVAGNLFGHIGSVSVSGLYPEGIAQ